MKKRLTKRQRYLLLAGWHGRVYLDIHGHYWLDKDSDITREFEPLIRRGFARSPQTPLLGHQMRRVLWFVEGVEKL